MSESYRQKISPGDRVVYVPGYSYDFYEQKPQPWHDRAIAYHAKEDFYEAPPWHTGTVVYHTTDDFFRIKWDDPNPDPEFFNLERVFKARELRLENEEGRQEEGPRREE